MATVELSAEHGEAQAFLTHRFYEYHGYMLAREGHLVRSYVYDGERKGVVRDVGARLPEERGVPERFDGPAFMTPTAMITDGRLPPEARSEGDVVELARVWSYRASGRTSDARSFRGDTTRLAALRACARIRRAWLGLARHMLWDAR